MNLVNRIQMKGLSKSFGKTQALQSVDWNLKPGMAVGLIGRNASGKSTLLQCAAGLLLPTSGTCETLGVDAGHLGEEQLCRIGYVGQTVSLLGWLSVEQHIRYVASFQQNWDKDLETDLRDGFDIPAKKRVLTLSQGMQRRLALLLALCHRPDLLLLDEPFSDLDPISRKDSMTRIMDRLIEDGTSVVISSHVLHDIEKVVDHIVCLSESSIVYESTLDGLKERYCEWTVRGALRKCPTRFSEDFILSCESKDSHTRLKVDLATADLAAFQARHGVQVDSRSLSFEEIFPLVVGVKS